ncbi:MAG: energy transducer TonB [Proteobacteria bacterium]|nr:energy transducer TonB [Pseudomonadota bacterium]
MGGGDAGVPGFGQEGAGETRQEGGGVWPPKDADAVPRYGDNGRLAYPPLARLRGYQGVVVLLVEVLVDGRVGQVGIRRSDGHEILDRAALEAVRTWRFEPGRKEGRAVTMSVEVPVRFVLNGN